MTKPLEYKGYLGSVEVDMEGGYLHGRLLFIRDIVGYNSPSIAELRGAFEQAVDEYLEDCSEHGDVADVPCKGSFNVRTGPALHREVALAARERDESLNEFVCHALAAAVGKGAPRIVENHVHTHNTTHIVANITTVSDPVTTASGGQQFIKATTHGSPVAVLSH